MFLNEIIYLAQKTKMELVALIPFKDAMVANATKEFFGPSPLSFSGRQSFNAPFYFVAQISFSSLWEPTMCLCATIRDNKSGCEGP